MWFVMIAGGLGGVSLRRGGEGLAAVWPGRQR